MITYFVSYAWYSGNRAGFGNCSVSRKNKITSINDVSDIADSIKNNPKYDKMDIVILFYKEFLNEDNFKRNASEADEV